MCKIDLFKLNINTLFVIESQKKLMFKIDLML